MNFSCFSPVLLPSPATTSAAPGTDPSPSICRMSALHPAAYPMGMWKRDVKEQSLWKLLLISLLKTVSSEVFLCQWIQLTDFRIALACQGRSALCHKNKTAWNLFLCTHSSQSHALRLELALMLVPSPLGAPKANEPLASLISSWDWRFSREDHCSFKGIVCFRKSLRLNEFCSWWIRCPVSKQNIKCKCSELTFHSFFTCGLQSESS